MKKYSKSNTLQNNISKEEAQRFLKKPRKKCYRRDPEVFETCADNQEAATRRTIAALGGQAAGRGGAQTEPCKIKPSVCRSRQDGVEQKSGRSREQAEPCRREPNGANIRCENQPGSGR